MSRVAACLIAVLGIVTLASCGTDDADSTVVLDETGFPTDWPVPRPPGSVTDCPNGQISRQEQLFSVVMCLPSAPDPFVASQDYLAELQADGFVEREPGAFLVEQETFLDGNGIEIFYQLVGNEATIVLIRPA